VPSRGDGHQLRPPARSIRKDPRFQALLVKYANPQRVR
jgi:hypothetical protein